MPALMIHHVDLAVSDVDRTIAFYRAVLGPLGLGSHVRPVTDMMLVFVALITAQGIGKMLEPNHNVFGAVATFLIPILMKRNESVPDTDEARAARLPRVSA